MRALACGCWEKWSENSEGEDTDLKVENFIVVHDHVNCPSELLPMGLRVNLKNCVTKYLKFRFRDLFDGDLVGLAPLHANSRI